MTRQALGSRHIHLDFHTPGDVVGVGADFDSEKFAHTFAEAHVDSVNVFAKCHHGYAYYPTAVGVRHPGLDFDLLGAQIAALHERGIRAPIYVSVLWDDVAGVAHPEWMSVDREGRVRMRPPLTAGAAEWTTLDISSGYRDYLFAMVRELCERYDVDGFWFDILWPEPNYAPWAQERARSLGVDLADERQVWRLATDDLLAFQEDMTDLVRHLAPGASIFYNGSVFADAERYAPTMTHLEVESLPTSGALWGYMHYPVLARYVRTLGRPMIGMTGRFQKSWADFGGLKPLAQLEYECGTILAAGGSVSIGDQLDPSGQLDPAVYRTVGAALERVERLAPWLSDSRPIADIAVIADRRERYAGRHPRLEFSAAVEGAAQMLLDLHLQFDIVDPAAIDLAGYRVIVVPDGLVGDEVLHRAVAAAHAAGAHLVISGRGGVDAGGGWGEVPVPAMPGDDLATVPAYLTFGSGVTASPDIDPDYPYVFYGPALELRPGEGAATSGELRLARANRSWDRFFSHQHAPAGERTGLPLLVRGERITMIALPVFGVYQREDYWVYRELVAGVLRVALPDPVVAASAPPFVELAAHRQATAEGERLVVHLTSFTPRRSASAVPRIDESARIHGITVDVRARRRPTAAYLAPSREPLEVTWEAGRAVLRLPPIGIHSVVVVEGDRLG